MPKKFESGLKGKYPHLSKQELGLIRLFFYVNLSLLIGALFVVLFDLFNFFSTNYFPHALSFLGIFIPVFFFLREGKKNAALNMLLFIPVPVYMLMISARFAVFPPESSFI
ncbi:MAG: hypothetical protein M1292_04625, partial [Bacteroidetes bacterium]|nr:hypothetical protein [Bacteroidota bacterium]